MVCGPIHAQTGKYGWYITTRQSVSWFMQCVLVPAWTGKYEMKTVCVQVYPFRQNNKSCLHTFVLYFVLELCLIVDE